MNKWYFQLFYISDSSFLYPCSLRLFFLTNTIIITSPLFLTSRLSTSSSKYSSSTLASDVIGRSTYSTLCFFINCIHYLFKQGQRTNILLVIWIITSRQNIKYPVMINLRFHSINIISSLNMYASICFISSIILGKCHCGYF